MSGTAAHDDDRPGESLQAVAAGGGVFVFVFILVFVGDEEAAVTATFSGVASPILLGESKFSAYFLLRLPRPCIYIYIWCRYHR